VADEDAALAGARDIVAETMAERADLRAIARQVFARTGQLVSEVVPKKAEGRTKFEQYYDFREAVVTIPSHRFLAVRRGEEEGVLRLKIDVDVEQLLDRIQKKMGLAPQSPFAEEMTLAVRDGYKRLLAPSIEVELRTELKLRADRGAVEIFADNLRNLLLARRSAGSR